MIIRVIVWYFILLKTLKFLSKIANLIYSCYLFRKKKFGNSWVFCYDEDLWYMYYDFFRVDFKRILLLDFLIFLLIFYIYTVVFFLLTIVAVYFIIVNSFKYFNHSSIILVESTNDYYNFFINNPKAFSIFFIYRIKEKNLSRNDFRLICLNFYYIFCYNASRFKIENCLQIVKIIKNAFSTNWRINIVRYILKEKFSTTRKNCHNHLELYPLKKNHARK